MDKMKSGDIYEVADVVRNLSFKQKEKRNGYDAAFYCSLYRCSDFNVYRC